jgi:hypothetical protein
MSPTLATRYSVTAITGSDGKCPIPVVRLKLFCFRVTACFTAKGAARGTLASDGTCSS